MDALPITDLTVYNSFHYVEAVKVAHSIFPYVSYDGGITLDSIAILVDVKPSLVNQK